MPAFKHAVVVVLCILPLLVPQAAAGSSNARLLNRLRQQQQQAGAHIPPCQPWAVPESDRCAYVKENAALCYPDGGFQRYLVVHYCLFGATWRWASLLLLFAASLLAFAVLLTVSERFFCPALELISDHLRLPPVVAGATLLSFGNGAPDTFTQVAAVAQEGSAAVGMAIAEPLGGGMFATNVVFGLVVLIASKQQAVVQRWAFLKDTCFYLCSLVIVAFMLADGKVNPTEAAVMCCLYVVYVCATFYTSRADEPLHADVALHEFPPEDGGIDVHDSSSVDLDFASEMDAPEYIDATTSIREFDLEAPASRFDNSCNTSSSSPTDSEPLQQLQHPDALAPAGCPAAAQEAAAAAAVKGSSGSRTLQALLSWKHRGNGAPSGLREPLLLAIDESPATSRDGQLHSGTNLSFEANSSGDTIPGMRSVSSSTKAAQQGSAAAPAGSGVGSQTPRQQQQQQQQQGQVRSGPSGTAQRQRRSSQDAAVESSLPPLPAPVFARLAAPDLQGQGPFASQGLAPGQQQSPRSSGSRGFGAHGRRSFTEGLRHAGPSTSSPTHSQGGSARGFSPVAPAAAADGSGSVQGWSPRAASESMLPGGTLGLPSGALSPCRAVRTSLGLPPYALDAAATGAGAGWGGAVLAGDRPLLLPQSPLTPQRRAVSETGWRYGDAVLGGSPISPGLQQLQQQHFAEQVELLEQQAAEHHALLAEHEEQQEAGKAGGMSFKHKLQYPLVQLLSFTMPRVGTGSGHRYGRWRACLLPLTVPLLWLTAEPDILTGLSWEGVLFGCCCAAVGSLVIWATYPASSVPRKALKGVFAFLAFIQAIVWLDLSASALVQVCVVVGVIFGLQPALLGATVLAWGNSVPDLVNNSAMARDGFPSMAVAACFASPLFTLLVGMGGALAYGTALQGGSLSVPVDGPLLVMAGFSIANMVQHLIVVPLVHRFKLRRSLAAITFCFYICFSLVYILTILGVINIQVRAPGGA